VDGPSFPRLPLGGCDAGIEGLDDEAFWLGGLGGGGEAGAEEAVDGPLQGLASAAVLLFEESGYVVVEGEGVRTS
jgi:hypothetical protein